MILRQIMDRVLTITLTVLILFVLLEVTLQLWPNQKSNGILPTELFTKSSSDTLIYELRPDSYVDEIYVTSINSFGIRDKEYEKETEKYRILIIGDSVPFGLGVSDGENFADLLEEKFNNSVEVLNFGVPGYKATQIVELLRLKGIQYNPDLVIYSYTLNDADNYNNGIDLFFQDDVSACKIYLTVPIECFLKSILKKSEVLDFISGRAYNIIKGRSYTDYYTSIYQDSNKVREVSESFATLYSLSEQEDFGVLLLLIPLISDFDNYKWQHIHDQVTTLASNQNIPTLDLLPSFQQHSVSNLRVDNADVIHPNQQGHELIAQELYTNISTN